MDKTRKNTMKMVFANTAKAPAHLDVLKFTAKVLKIAAAIVHSIYKDENDRCFYIKFIDDANFDQFMNGIEEHYRFEYADGQHTFVKLEVASRLFRYVRIFNLPPETEDKEIASVLGQFGTVRQHVRERYPADYGYSVYSGIRGVHMEISKEIPANLYIGHFKARLYYDGLKNKCFYCKQEGHIKADCPKAASARTSAERGGAGTSYSSILAGAIHTNKPGQNTPPIQMTPLATKSDGTSSKTDRGASIPSAEERGESKAATASKVPNKEGMMEADDTTTTATEDGGAIGETSSRRGRSKSKKATNLLDELETRSRSRSNVRKEGKGGAKKASHPIAKT